DLKGLFFRHQDSSAVEGDVGGCGSYARSGRTPRGQLRRPSRRLREASLRMRTKTAPAFPGLRASKDRSEPRPASKGRAPGARQRWLVPAAVAAAAATAAAAGVATAPAVAAPSTGAAAARTLLAGLGLVDGQAS